MHDENLLASLANHIKTQDNSYEFLFQLEALHDHIFASEKNAQGDLISTYLSKDNAEFIKRFTTGLQYEQLDQLVLQIIEILKKLPTFRVTLAFKPDEAFTDILFSWTTKNVGSTYLLEIEVDPEIIGGGVFVLNGIYKDFSLRKQLVNLFQNSDVIKELL